MSSIEQQDESSKLDLIIIYKLVNNKYIVVSGRWDHNQRIVRKVYNRFSYVTESNR